MDEDSDEESDEEFEGPKNWRIDACRKQLEVNCFIYIPIC